MAACLGRNALPTSAAYEMAVETRPGGIHLARGDFRNAFANLWYLGNGLAGLDNKHSH